MYTMYMIVKKTRMTKLQMKRQVNKQTKQNIF